MKLLLENWRKFINEATEHDDKFKTLMDAGWNGIKQAMELADTLGIPSQELPWDFKSVSDYVYETGGPYGGVPGETERELLKNQLANVGWELDEWDAAVRQDAIDFNARFSRERKHDLRESVDFENWRKYLNEEHAKPTGAEFKINHNLFVDYMNNNPDYQAFMKTNPGDHKLNQKLHQEYKWDFPHDVDISSDDCHSKLLYLDQLVSSFLRNPRLYDISQEPENIAEKVSLDLDDSPYRKCREKSDIESTRKREREEVDAELYGLREK